MAVNVIVIREAGDIPAPDIIDPLVTTEEVAVSCGTQFLDANHKNRTLETTNGPFNQWMAPGSLLEVIDAEFVSYKALLTGVSISVTKGDTSFTVDANLSLEKIADG